jgi:hypothetical protein
MLTKQEKFVLEWLNKNLSACVMDAAFHEAFHEKFGGKRKEYMFGAQPVDKAQKLLASMYRRGIISRKIVSLGGNWQYGFPKWVYVYCLSCCAKNKGCV